MDEDDIVANDFKRNIFFKTLVNSFFEVTNGKKIQFNMFTPNMVSSEIPTNITHVKDLLAIPDLMAGAFGFSYKKSTSEILNKNFVFLPDSERSWKNSTIIDAFMNNNRYLKKINVVLDGGEKKDGLTKGNFRLIEFHKNNYFNNIYK